MVDKILREDARQTQTSAEKALEQDTADLARRQGQSQVEYMRSMGKPSDRAKAAFRAAGIPLDQILPADIVAFEHKADGSFVLKLARDLKIHIGGQALLLGSTISGILSMQHIRNLRGIGIQKTHENAVTTGKVSHLSFLNGELLLETDNAALKKINLRGEALGDIAG
jgi:hypothetical protein